MTTDDLNLGTDTVQQAVQRIADAYQVDFVTLHLFCGGDDAQNKPYVRTNYPDAWVSHYLLNDYVRIDPILEMVEQIAAPFCWSGITPRPEQLDMMQHAIQHGVGQTGFSVRHVDAIGRRSVLSFNAHSAKDGPTWEPFISQQRDKLILLAHEIHHMALAELYGDNDALPQLYPREIECLRWTHKARHIPRLR